MRICVCVHSKAFTLTFHIPHCAIYFWLLLCFNSLLCFSIQQFNCLGFWTYKHFYLWRVWLSKWVQQKSLYMNILSNHIICQSISSKNRQTYVSKTANTNKMTKKRKFIATTAIWSTFPSASWSRTALSATKQKQICKLIFFHTITCYRVRKRLMSVKYLTCNLVGS